MKKFNSTFTRDWESKDNISIAKCLCVFAITQKYLENGQLVLNFVRPLHLLQLVVQEKLNHQPTNREKKIRGNEETGSLHENSEGKGCLRIT